jgi:glycosyltransferase involved in cell wall biosynthesis
VNLLRIVYEWPPPWGGLTPGPFELTHAQANLGHRIRVLCGGWPRHPVQPLHNVDIRRLLSAFPKLSLFVSTAPLAWLHTLLLTRKVDLIHGHGHLPFWYHLWRKRTGKRHPYVLHLHITAAGRAVSRRKAGALPLDVWTRAWEWPLHERSDEIGCQVANAVICTSRSVRDEAVRFYGADPQKLHIVPNGVNVQRFTPKGGSERHRWNLSPEDKVVLFVGALVPRKRPDLLIQALLTMPESWKLLIVGKGPLQDKLKAQTKALQLRDRVLFAGYIPYPSLPAIYRMANVLALPSSYEGLPKVVLEALASGVPVAASGFETEHSGLQSAINWLSPNGTPEATANALIRAAHQPITDLSEIRDVLSWNSRAQAVEDIYQRVLSEGQTYA